MVLAKDASEQLTETTALTKAEADVDNMRKTLGKRQVERYARFTTALNAARGAFRGDPATLALLEPFKRATRPRVKKAEE